MSVIQPTVDLHAAPASDAPLDTQLMMGEAVLVHGQHDGWSWVESLWDGYQGYARSTGLAEDTAPPNARVIAARSFRYAAPDLKAAWVDCLPMGAEVCVVDRHETSNGTYSSLADGTAIFDGHLAPIDHLQPDWIATARSLMGTPYLWAGRTSLGFDCSAFVQTALRMAGIRALRDSDMQAATLGGELDPDTPLDALVAGDLVFWRGHVGMLPAPGQLLHCNARTMNAAEEPLAAAVERIAKLYERPTVFRRLGVQ